MMPGARYMTMAPEIMATETISPKFRSGLLVMPTMAKDRETTPPLPIPAIMRVTRNILKSDAMTDDSRFPKRYRRAGNKRPCAN